MTVYLKKEEAIWLKSFLEGVIHDFYQALDEFPDDEIHKESVEIAESLIKKLK